jgi:uncharacterized membrane protein YeaQ/YmgE (transglycosylase-associated protein family)
MAWSTGRAAEREVDWSAQNHGLFLHILLGLLPSFVSGASIPQAVPGEPLTMKTTAIFLSVLGALPSTYAWGALGHETVGYVASNFLQPATVTWAQNILKDSTSSYLANVASWADSYRATTAGRFSAPYHFIDALDNPPSSCSVSYSRDCGTKGCVVSAISNYVRTSRLHPPSPPSLLTKPL